MQKIQCVLLDCRSWFKLVCWVIYSPHIQNFSDLIGENKLSPILESDFLLKDMTFMPVILLYYQRNVQAGGMFAIPSLSLKILNVIFKHTTLNLKDYVLFVIQNRKV